MSADSAQLIAYHLDAGTAGNSLGSNSNVVCEKALAAARQPRAATRTAITHCPRLEQARLLPCCNVQGRPLHSLQGFLEIKGADLCLRRTADPSCACCCPHPCPSKQSITVRECLQVPMRSITW